MSNPALTTSLQKPASRASVKRHLKAEEEAHERAVHKAVDARDGHRCRVCGRRCDPHAIDLLRRAHRHHLVYRSAGGATTTGNLVSLCADCHADVHRHVLDVRGDGDTGIKIWCLSAEDGWYQVKRETACGQTERD